MGREEQEREERKKGPGLKVKGLREQGAWGPTSREPDLVQEKLERILQRRGSRTLIGVGHTAFGVVEPLRNPSHADPVGAVRPALQRALSLFQEAGCRGVETSFPGHVDTGAMIAV